MSGSLIKIDEEIVTSAVASVELGGANWDSSYDVYMVKYNDVVASLDGTEEFRLRFLASSSADISANYDSAYKQLRTDTTFANRSYTNQDHFLIGFIGANTGERQNGILYLFNFNNASVYSFMTTEATTLNYSATLSGYQGGGTLTVAQSTNGVQFYNSSTDIAQGKFTLYGLKK